MVAALVRQTSPGVPTGASDSLLQVRRVWAESLRDSRRRCRRIRHSRISPTSLGDSRAPRAALALISSMALDQAGRVGGSPRAIPVPTVQVLSPGSRWVIRVSSLGSRACPTWHGTCLPGAGSGPAFWRPARHGAEPWAPGPLPDESAAGRVHHHAAPADHARRWSSADDAAAVSGGARGTTV